MKSVQKSKPVPHNTASNKMRWVKTEFGNLFWVNPNCKCETCIRLLKLEKEKERNDSG